MCTLTWRDQDGLEVFFNRDELKTRSRAEPPRAFETEKGTKYLAPTDPDAGGTWMLANEHGLVVCLLNRWHEEGEQTFSKSRGLIVTQLANCSSLTDFNMSLPPLCDGAKPFDLICFSKGEVAGFTWSGRLLSKIYPHPPLTSSSFRFEEVKTAREKAFEESADLENFQNPQAQPASAFTVRMNRPDAQTWSRSQLKITTSEISWDYWEEFPDLAQKPELYRSVLSLALAVFRATGFRRPYCGSSP